MAMLWGREASSTRVTARSGTDSTSRTWQTSPLAMAGAARISEKKPMPRLCRTMGRIWDTLAASMSTWKDRSCLTNRR